MAKKKPVFWINGNYYDCSEAVKTIVEKYGNSNITVLDGSSDGVDRAIFNLAESEIFASGNKIIHLRGLPENYNLIYDYLKFVSDQRVLIIESPVVIRSGTKNVNASNSKLYKEIKNIGKVLDFPIELSDNKSAAWVSNVCEKAFRKTIEENAIKYILLLKNNNADLVYSELQKVSTYIGRRKKITEEDVRNTVSNVIIFDTWELVDDLTVGNIDKCLYRLEDYFLTRENFIYDVEMLLGAILFRFELLFLIRGSGSESFEDISKIISSFKKKTKEGVVEKYSSKALMAFRYSDTLKNALKLLGTIKLCSIVTILYFTLNSIRANNGDPSFCKLLLLNMVSAICGKTTREDFFEQYDGNNFMFSSY